MSVAGQMDNMPAGKATHRIFWLLGSGMLIDAFSIFMAGGVLAAMVASGFATTSGVASFAFYTFLGLALGSIISGVLADRFGRRFCYQFNLLLFGGAAILAALSPSFGAVIFLRFLMGIGLGGEIVTGYATMAEFGPVASRGRLNVTLGLLVNVAQPLAAFIGLAVLPAFGWQAMFWIAGVPAFIVWFLRRRLPESPRWLERKGRASEASAVVTSMWKENGGQGAPTSATTAALPAQELAWPTLFSRRLVGRTILCSILAILVLSALYGFLAWAPTILLKSGDTIVHSLLYTAIMSIGAPVGMIFAILWVDVIGRKNMVIWSAVIAAVAGVLYSFSLHANPVVLIIYGIVLVMLLQVTANTVIAIYIPELFPTDVRMTGAGFAIAVGRVGSAVFPFLVLAVLGGLGAQAVFILVSLVLLVTAGVIMFGAETRKRSLEDINQTAFVSAG